MLSDPPKKPFESFRGITSRWMQRRIPPAPKITLNQRSIFIFPTSFGFAFIALLLLLLFGAINYQNSLIFSVTFLLGSLFVITILHTYKNLSQLSLECIQAKNGFCGDLIEFRIRITRPTGSPRENIEIGWPKYGMQRIDLYSTTHTEQSIWSVGKQRGRLHPGRVRVSTTFPLGLLCAWTWVDLDLNSLVYPKPIIRPLPYSSDSNAVGIGELTVTDSGEDFFSMRPYHPGDSVKHVSWRHYARTDQLHLQQHATEHSQTLMLDWQQLKGDTETRLSLLTGSAQQAMQAELKFGLLLPNQRIQPDQGNAHYHRILTALALYPNLPS